MKRKWFCYFCKKIEYCVVEPEEKCKFRIPIWINPSERISYHEYENPVQIIGEIELIDIHPHFTKQSAFNKTYLKELKRRIENDK